MKKTITLLFISILAAAVFSSCSDNDDPVASITNPLAGVWNLSQINGANVSADRQMKYTFSEDPAATAGNYGTGTCQTMTADGWSEPVSLTWSINSDNLFVITPDGGSSATYRYSLIMNPSMRQLMLTDVITGTIYTFIN